MTEFYIYAADCWCPSCAETIRNRIAGEIANAAVTAFKEKLRCDMPSERSQSLYHDLSSVILDEVDKLAETDYDSDDFPKGPFAEEEVDSPPHCGSGEDCEEAEDLGDGCKIGALLSTSLTTHGVDYLNEMIGEKALNDHQKKVHQFWREQFDSYELVPDPDIPKYFRCGGCEHLHPFGWDGDCREDSMRFTDEQVEKKHGTEGVNWLEVDEKTGSYEDHEEPADEPDDRDGMTQEFTESEEGDAAKQHWAEDYDELNGAPEGDHDC